MAFRYAPHSDHPLAGLWSFAGDITGRTVLGLRFQPRGRDTVIWLPAAKIKTVETATGVEVCMPEWLARKVGLL